MTNFDKTTRIKPKKSSRSPASLPPHRKIMSVFVACFITKPKPEMNLCEDRQMHMLCLICKVDFWQHCTTFQQHHKRANHHKSTSGPFLHVSPWHSSAKVRSVSHRSTEASKSAMSSHLQRLFSHSGLFKHPERWCNLNLRCLLLGGWKKKLKNFFSSSLSFPPLPAFLRHMLHSHHRSACSSPYSIILHNNSTTRPITIMEKRTLLRFRFYPKNLFIPIMLMHIFGEFN